MAGLAQPSTYSMDATAPPSIISMDAAAPPSTSIVAAPAPSTSPKAAPAPSTSPKLHQRRRPTPPRPDRRRRPTPPRPDRRSRPTPPWPDRRSRPSPPCPPQRRHQTPPWPSPARLTRSDLDMNSQGLAARRRRRIRRLLLSKKNMPSSTSLFSKDCGKLPRGQYVSKISCIEEGVIGGETRFRKKGKVSRSTRDTCFTADATTEQYLKEELYPRKKELDILEWWKINSPKYPVLSTIARDMLAISASTVPSESAFSSGGRIVSDYRSSLSCSTIEALICLQDWLRAADPQKYKGASLGPEEEE